MLAIANQKGGVGKTTTAVNLATALAATGEPVLLVDLDPQGNASTGLGVDRAARGQGTYAMLIDGVPAETVIRASGIPHLSIIPSDADLAGAEVELVSTPSRETRLRNSLAPIRNGRFAFVLVDCPPSLGLLTVNGLVAADAVLVPLQCEFYALAGLAQLMGTVERVQRGLNPRLALQGVVLTMYDGRNNLCEQVAADVRGHFHDKVYKTMIPRNVRVSEAPSHGVPVLVYDQRCAGAQAYVSLAAEMLGDE
ncbi:MAG TPA: ParA family protein [Acetobacteraceae bacterium]|nr:ParA family protein [Acetobacteraceae bacterium]